MLNAISLGLTLPLLGFLTLLMASNRIGRRLAGLIGCGTVLLAFACFAGVLPFYVQGGMIPQTLHLFNWLSLPGIEVNFSLHLDSLSLLMTLIVTGVGFLIHIYSIGYMDHESDFARYFACLNFFIFAMLLLVLAGDLILLFIGWESVGLASYLLIGFWYTRPAAAQAATKAFVVNRIGDLGLLLGLLLTLQTFGTTDITAVSQMAMKGFAIGAPVLTAITLLYFWGATGKSAQLPLYNWLPDAMEGPTPVSALIHAATMVTAGVYLVVRMHTLFSLSPETLHVIGIVGGATALFASFCALAQTDLKRVLAYSTVSQLGLMFLACGVGAYYAAMFHLTIHAFVKALLFLSAGNVVHMMHDTTSMDKMGGLSKIFTKTHWLFLLGALALAGVPPFAAFFSKDLILELEHLQGSDSLFFVGLAASILTGIYMIRAYCLTFTGEPRASRELLRNVKEAPPVMLMPLSILAILTLIGGFLGFAFTSIPPLEYFLEELGISSHERELSTGLHLSLQVWMALLGSFLGVGASALIYTRYYQRLGQPWALLRHSFYVEDLYGRLVVRPLKSLASLIVEFFEARIFEKSMTFSARAVQSLSKWMQLIQSGQVRSYIAWIVTGSAFLIVYFITEGFHA
ncbi:NADH-ubiquinone oxidoreductase subunit L [Candidatus Protochlamydia naegleriophila]|uniref:NADH-ubiquinone oxidoreductase subunit L n=1 Tax=Candidatus Protochlamydia naegleriophila TaxID=389348 RepID=A0A0U5JBD5_9BACT|nr:NADH-quinone oxidoreductase subunit L [Candidatus Protochlamydia naegleriophila]CUI17353.1 NADH-ubiquinone oxidoreductase subunit L [Candidatus Protochlamydia naegleriophila]